MKLMGLLDKIKSDLRKADAVIITPNSVELEPVPILDALNDDETIVEANAVEDNNYLFPFKNREELKAKATELKIFFSEKVLSEKRTTFGKCTSIQNPKDFIQGCIKLMATYWHDQLYVRDRVCDLAFLKECFEKGKVK